MTYQKGTANLTENQNILDQSQNNEILLQTAIFITIPSTAVKMINKHASPGSDGLTASFYTSFPSLVKLLTNVHNNMIFQHQMSPSQREALVKLIPKKTHPKTVKEWRPISLLNVDYKILTTTITNRLKPILQQYISEEQQCGLPNRQIFNNHLNKKIRNRI